MTLRGQGSVVATVVNANGTPVSGAHVAIKATTTDSAFIDNLFGTTGANGTVVIDHVLAGTLEINGKRIGSEQRPSRSFGRSHPRRCCPSHSPCRKPRASSEPSSHRTTRRRRPAHVTLTGGIGANATLGEDGTFRFDGRPLGQYVVKAFDTQGHLRAQASVTLATNNQELPVSLKFVAEGSVTGRVIYPEGTSAPNRTVQVRSLNPLFGRQVSVQTNAAGFYVATHIAAGAMNVSASDPARQLLGENSGVIDTQDEPITLDILLASNGITLPRTLLDASAFTFDVQPGGAILGTNSTFVGSGIQGGPLLDLVIGGAATRFLGNTVGTIEDQGREIAVRQQDVAGLDVTRKVFVPKEGYFARYLETISNPTAAPITLDVRVTSYVQRRHGGERHHDLERRRRARLHGSGNGGSLGRRRRRGFRSVRDRFDNPCPGLRVRRRSERRSGRSPASSPSSASRGR